MTDDDLLERSTKVLEKCLLDIEHNSSYSVAERVDLVAKLRRSLAISKSLQDDFSRPIDNKEMLEDLLGNLSSFKSKSRGNKARSKKADSQGEVTVNNSEDKIQNFSDNQTILDNLISDPNSNPNPFPKTPKYVNRRPSKKTPSYLSQSQKSEAESKLELLISKNKKD